MLRVVPGRVETVEHEALVADYADRDRIRRELAALKNVPTVLGNGKYSYDANRNAAYGATLITVQDGKVALAPN